jgi:hypothetical protein
MRTRLLGFTLTLIATTALVGACGSSDSKTPATGGTGGKSASAGGSSSVETDAGSGVPCGTKMCAPSGGAEACCKSAFDSTCGFKSGANCVDNPPLAASNCPSFTAGGFTLKGCCTPAKMCGIDSSQFPGGGCTENGAAKAGAKGMSMGFLGDAGLAAFPAPQACPP